MKKILLILLCALPAHAADNAFYARCYQIAKPCYGRAECNAKSGGCYDRCDKPPARPLVSRR